jgi:ABC-2 type transport system permease protein
MSTATVPANLAFSMPRGRLLRTYLVEARYESLRALRAPAFAIPFLALPIALYVLFGVLLAGNMSHGDPTVAKIMFVNFSVFGIMGPGMFGFGMFVATERSQGLLALKRALPMPPASYLAAKMAMTLLFSAIIMASLIVPAAAWGHVRLTFGQFLAIGLIDMLGSLPFCAVGLLVGTLASAKSAPAFINLAYLPMMHLGGLFYPLPRKVQIIERFSPAFYLDKLGLKMAGVPSLDQLATGPSGNVSVVLCFLALASVTAFFATLSIRRLSGRSAVTKSKG